MGVELITELESGKHYRVEFYLSLQDSLWYASKNVGAYFSLEQPPSNIDSIQSYHPQVRYEGDFITDKEGWTLVSGSFIAQGGERFITIGNFDKYDATEALFISGGGIPPSHSATYWESAGYFIDDVSVVPDSTTAVHEVAISEPTCTLYPNPNTGEFTLLLNLTDNDLSTMQVWSISGQQVFDTRLQNGNNTVNLNVAEGLYLYRVTVNGTTQWTGKVSITSP